MLNFQNEVLYTAAMRNVANVVVLIFSLCLLAMQVNGLHLHVNPSAAGGLDQTHLHGVAPGGHGHESDTDVSLFDLNSGWAKLLPFLLPFIATSLGVWLFGQQIWTPIALVLHRRRRSRWRPPLRAPPVPLL